MAIVDTRESGSSRATATSGAESTQEEVELTELLPVKQSRIRENGIFANSVSGGDGNAGSDGNAKISGVVRSNGNGNANATTDALKALRRFDAGDRNENEREFHLRNFASREKIGDRGKRENGKRSARVEKSVTERKEKGEGIATIRRKRRDITRRSNETVLANCPKKGRIEGFGVGLVQTGEQNEKKSKGNNGGESTRDRTVEGSERRNEKTFVFSVFGQEEDAYPTYQTYQTYPAHPTFNENKDFTAEIYAFRRDSLDLNAALDPVHDKVANRIYGNDYSSSTDGSLFDRGFDHGCDPNGKRPSFDIEAVLTANYFLESENNNVLRSNPDKVAEICSGSLIPASKIDVSSSSKHEYNDDNAEGENASRNRVSEGDETAGRNETRRSSSTNDPDNGNRRGSVFGNENESENGNNNGNGQEEKKYCCVVCESRFKGSGGLRNHYKIVHGAGPIFKCDECGKEFPLKERLKLHVRTHTGFKPYKCPECDKSFARGGQLVQHRRTHSQVKPYRCGLCSGTFTCAANLALHVKRHNGQKDHKCEICGRAFVRRDALKKHLECLHRDVKSFLCVICNKTFKGHLPQHMRTHARDRPHGCATCGQRFAQKSQLTVHQRTHSGQRPFRCLVCWQAFAHSTALKLHTRRHTGERPFKCAECNAGFTQLPHWKKHMKCIHGRTEPYACKRCKSFFRIKNDLECHEKTCHSELDSSNPDGRPGANAFFDDILEKPTPLPPLQTASIPPTTPTIQTTQTTQPSSKYRTMSVERMRLLLAVLLKRISKQERLDELGFGKRLIDEVLRDSLLSAGKDPIARDGLTELETLTGNLEIFLKWTVPKEHWENFCKLNKTPEDILETLTAT
nr:uncharacterized protein LOC116428122 [Nomia melanderi]XP_031835191.1 uncharacterized protein LOC116428122 [Nomia melanderi]